MYVQTNREHLVRNRSKFKSGRKATGTLTLTANKYGTSIHTSIFIFVEEKYIQKSNDLHRFYRN
jgi:hypothetical protein